MNRKTQLEDRIRLNYKDFDKAPCVQHSCLPWDNLILEHHPLDNRCQLFSQVLSFWVLQLCIQVVGQIFTGVWFDSACVIGK